MKITKAYRNTQVPTVKLKLIRDYINSQHSASLGEIWGHKHWGYVLNYGPNESVSCRSYDEVASYASGRGETTSHKTYFESQTGRLLEIDTTDPTRIIVNADNKSRTVPFLTSVEVLLELEPLPRRVFITHGRSELWRTIQRFIEKDAHLNLEAVELAESPSKGRTVSEKLRDEGDTCSYAVIVMTGDDMANNNEVRARENVLHEIGFFQGRYGFDRICLLHEEAVNIPSNLAGLVYISFPRGNVDAALVGLLRELRAAFR